MARNVVRRLVAWDETARSSVVLDPGSPVSEWRILPNPNAGEELDLGVYAMEFESSGRRLRCSLVQFQSRTDTRPFA